MRFSRRSVDLASLAKAKEIASVGGGGNGRRVVVGESADKGGENPTGVLSGGREEHAVFPGGGGPVLGSDDIIGQSVGCFR